MKKIYENVKLGEGSQISDFVIIGMPPKGKKDGELKTVIGKNITIKPFTTIYSGTTVGDNCFIAEGAIIRENCNIGNGVIVGSNSVILPDVTIEDDVTIHALVEVADHSQIKYGAWIGPGVKMANNIHPKQIKQCEHKKRGDIEGAPKIGKHARIGVNTTINSFVNIGDYAITGVGAVVTKDIPPKSVVVGNPAKFIKNIRDLKCRYCNNKPYDIEDENTTE